MFSLDEVKWWIKPSANGTYVKMLQPSDYDIDVEDLDADTYRAITTGNLIDTVVSINWSKCKFKFNALTKAQVSDLVAKVSANPIYAKIENPIWGSGYIEAQFRCSKKSISKCKTHDARYDVSLNLVQKNKVSGM